MSAAQTGRTHDCTRPRSITCSLLHRRGRPHMRYYRELPPRRGLRRQDLAGSKARRPPGRAADPFRSRDQPQGGEGARPYHLADAPRPRGRSHRIAHTRSVRDTDCSTSLSLIDELQRQGRKAHIAAIRLALTSLALFIFGMVAVRRSVGKLPTIPQAATSPNTQGWPAPPLRSALQRRSGSGRCGALLRDRTL